MNLSIIHPEAIEVMREIGIDISGQWNLLEGLVATLSGALADSIAVVGFGFDSLIEVTSGAALL